MNGSTRQKISLQKILLNFFEALMIAFGPNCKKSRTVKGLDRTSSKDFSKVVIQNDLLTHILLYMRTCCLKILLGLQTNVQFKQYDVSSGVS